MALLTIGLGIHDFEGYHIDEYSVLGIVLGIWLWLTYEKNYFHIFLEHPVFVC